MPSNSQLDFIVKKMSPDKITVDKIACRYGKYTTDNVQVNRGYHTTQ